MRLYRLLRGGAPEPDDAKGAAHVGDFSSPTKAKAGAKPFAGSGPLYLEPIELVHGPEPGQITIRNAGAITELKR